MVRPLKQVRPLIYRVIVGGEWQAGCNCGNAGQNSARVCRWWRVKRGNAARCFKTEMAQAEGNRPVRFWLGFRGGRGN